MQRTTQNHSGQIKRFISAILILTFAVTGLLEESAGFDAKRLWAAPGASSGAGSLGTLQESAGLAQSFQTDIFTGRAQFSIPVFSPPARRGLTPQVALGYSSSGGSSWLGQGWELDHGFIQRSTKKGIPSYNDAQDIFTFVLNGVNSDLIKISATEYRAKDESGEFLKFIYQNGFWMVYDKSGTAYTFGQNAQARSTNARGIFCWCLEKIKDVYGNTIQYAYTMDQGEMYIQRIDYNANETENFSATHSVEFTLENRPDVTFSYLSGAKVTTAKRLKEVQVKVQNQLSRKYILTYETSPVVQKSRLKEVQECGTDGVTCLPPQAFTYQDHELQLESQFQTVPIQNGGPPNDFNSLWYQDGPATRAGHIDMNGDGISDRLLTTVAYPYNQFRIQFGSAAGGFGSMINWPIAGNGDTDQGTLGYTSLSVGATQLETIDMNGDGFPDRVWANAIGDAINNWRVELNTGSGFAAPVYWHAQNDFPGYWYQGVLRLVDASGRTYQDLADINGDGLTDRVTATFAVSTLNWQVQLNNGTDFNTFQNWSISSATCGDDPMGCWPVRYIGSVSETRTDLVDMNGDGLPDRVHVVAPYTSFKISFNNGAGFEPPVAWAVQNPNGGGQSSYIRQGNVQVTQDLMDVNADGLPDRLVSKTSAPYDTIWVQFNTGSGFQPPVAWAINNLNPNSQDTGSIRWFKSAQNLKYDTRDFDGDGLPDRAEVVDSGSYNTWKTAKQTGQFPDLLKTINNGRGGTTTFEYTPSTRFDNQNTSGVYKLPFPVNVVTKVTQSDGLGRSYVTNFSYKGGMYDSVSREFRGFREVTVTDARGTQTKTTFLQGTHSRGRPAQVEVRDAQGNLFSRQVNDWGNCVDDAFPGVHFVKLRQTDQYLYDGDSTFKHTRKRFEYDGANGNLVTTYDDGNPDEPADDRRQVTDYVQNAAVNILNTVSKTAVYDSQNSKINEKYFYYDSAADINATPQRGSLTKQEDLLASGDPRPATKISYDSLGNLQTVTDAMDRVTTNEYDPTLKLYLTKVTNALGQKQEFTYDARIAQITQTKDQNNQISRTVYDSLGRAVKVISPLDTDAAPTQAVFYDDVTVPNRVVTHVKVDTNAPALSAIDDQPHAGYLTTYAFMDGLGRQIQKRAPAEAPGMQIVSGNVTFDARGQVQDQYIPYVAAFRTTYAQPDSSVPHASFTYDAVGRRTRVDMPDGTHSEVIYDDYIKTVIDPNLNQKRYTQDSFGNLIQVEEFNEGEIYTTHYEYDPLNRLIRTTDQAGNVTEVSYDLLGRKTGMFDPNMGTWYYEYDQNNNLISQTDAKGQTIYFEYDSLNRLTKKTYPNNTHVDYVYDDCPTDTCGGLVGENYPKGKLLKVTDASGVQTFRYDKLGRVIQDRKEPDDGNDYTFTRIYDPQGRVTSLEYPDGDILNLTFNTAGDAETMTLVRPDQTTAPIISNVDYNASAQITKIIYGNGVVSDYTYNPQTLRLEHLLTKNQAQVTLQDFGYQFDNAGNVLSITDAINTNTQSFQYDDLDRLTQATGSYGTHSFQYDPIGNMTQKHAAALQYNDYAHPHAVTRYQNGSETIHYQYDANGNMTRRSPSASGSTQVSEILTYDYDNRLTKLERQTTTSCQIQPVPYDPLMSVQSTAGSSPSAKTDVIAPAAQFGGSPLSDDAEAISVPSVIAKRGQDIAEAIHDPEIAAASSMTAPRNDMSQPNTIFYPCDGTPHTTTATIAEHVYDASGQRVKRVANGKTTYYLGKDFEIESGSSSSLTQPEGSTLVRKAFFLGDTRIAELELASTSGAVPHLRFFHGDHLGSTNVITNEQGQQSLLMEYLPYGEVKLRVGTDPVHNTFTGQKEDLESGLMYYNARFYDPKIGRFIQADSIVGDPSNPQSFNRYSYVDNNPIKFTDPTGHKKKKFWKSFWKAFVGAAVGALIAVLAAPLMPLWAAGMLGGAIGGATTGALNGGMRGALIGAGIGAALGGIGGWGVSTYGSSFGYAYGGALIAGGIATAAVTGDWGSFAGGISGAYVGSQIGGGINSAIYDGITVQGGQGGTIKGSGVGTTDAKAQQALQTSSNVTEVVYVRSRGILADLVRGSIELVFKNTTASRELAAYMRTRPNASWDMHSEMTILGRNAAELNQGTQIGGDFKLFSPFYSESTATRVFAGIGARSNWVPPHFLDSASMFARPTNVTGPVSGALGLATAEYFHGRDRYN